jgi:hypothetical protein
MFPVGKNNRVVLFFIIVQVTFDTSPRQCIRFIIMNYSQCDVYTYMHTPCTRAPYFIIVIGFIYLLPFFSLLVSPLAHIVRADEFVHINVVYTRVRNARGEIRSRVKTLFTTVVIKNTIKRYLEVRYGRREMVRDNK